MLVLDWELYIGYMISFLWFNFAVKEPKEKIGGNGWMIFLLIIEKRDFRVIV